MTMRRRTPTLAWAVLSLLLVGACSKPAEPLKITAIDLGHRVNDDNRIPSPSETYAPADTVYASISVEGTGSGTLTARWTSADGQLLSEQTQKIAPTAPAHFEFHLAQPGGWPKGRHKAVFTLNGGGSRTREFEVR
ncbi:MAG: hypothetical protein HY271_17590 [Deltaproteobacteria bacterium]|nr:hypothetical protein [Deltaproteobacteria bacterium]